MKINTIALPALTDNYIWIIEQNQSFIIVDPGEIDPCHTFLSNHNPKYLHTLITHHHFDHTGGLDKLAALYPSMSTFGPNLAVTPKKFTDVSSQHSMSIPGFLDDWQIFASPGHTQDHLCYYLPSGPGYLFCGDTLFSAGCGRLLEGNAAQMLGALDKIADLGDETIVFPAHEYTLNNLRFAKYIDPENSHISTYYEAVLAKRDQGLPSLPSTIALEKKINPFLRVREIAIIEKTRALSGDRCDTAVATFAALRKLKDKF